VNHGNLLVIVMLALQAATVLAYAWQMKWADAVYWLGAFIINAAVLYKAL
jgi:hypothetical protein